MTVEVLWRDYIGSVIQRDGYYEPNIVRLLTSLLKPGAVFFDVGAHIGQYSLVASRLVGPTGQVHAFEPDPDTFRTLSGNCRRNRLNNVRLNQIALSNTEGRALFHFATMADIGSNSLAECDPYNRSGRSAEIECRTIREYCRERGIARIDIMKMDVEGAESAVLSGGDGLFTGPARPVAIIEFEEKRQQAFGSSCAALRAWLLERNYRLFVIGETIRPYVPSAADPRSFNVLALPAERQDVVQG